MTSVPNPLTLPQVRNKIAAVRAANPEQLFEVPERIARDVSVAMPENLPPKLGLSSQEGQARLLHDLASIELQAMELGFRTWVEFPKAPLQFREEIWELTLEEARHLELCLNAIEALGFSWGHWPVHTLLWQSVSAADSLLDRVLIVHRYLEGSGLDAGGTLLRRLKGVPRSPLHDVVETIVHEEVKHCDFGSRWYRILCEQAGLDSRQDFSQRILGLRSRLPKRIEPLSLELRSRAGFTDGELAWLNEYRNSIIKYPPVSKS